MSSPKTPTLRRELVDQEMKRLLSHVLGTTHWFPVLVGIAFLASLGWFSDSLFNTLDALARWAFLGQRPGQEFRVQLVLLIPFLALLGWLLGRARMWRERLRFRVVSERPPRQAKALVLFLSAPKPFERDEVMASYDEISGDLADAGIREQIEKAWRMPIEALASHQRTVDQLVLVTSPGKYGSHGLLGNFLELVERLWPDHRLRVRTVGDFLPDLSNGVDFFDLERQVQALDTVIRRLVAEGLRPEDIVIDVTGGTKLSTVAGQSVALAEGRRFQYVFTEGYEVVAYEASYLEDEDGAALTA